MSKLPEKWKVLSISDFAKTSAGGTPSTQIQEYWDGGDIPWMSSGEVHKKRVFAVDGYITQSGYNNSSAKLFPPKTILMALAGQGKTRGTVAISEIELTTNQSIAGISVTTGDVSPDFVYHNLDSRYDELRGVSGGSGRAGLNLTIINEQELLLPPLPEQKKIAAILTSVDDVIGKTQAQIDKLKDLKTGMMQELLTRGVSVDGKPHTEFKDSPVGRIPKRWDCVLMEAICTKITDGEHQTPKRTTEGYYLLSARNVRDGYIDLTNVDYVGGDEFQRISKRVSPKQGDILISCSGSVGRVAVVPPKLEFSMVRSVAILQLNKDIVDPYFMAVQVAATAIQDQIEKSLSQLAQANLFQGAIKKLVVVVPTMPEQKRIASAVNSIANKIAKLQDGLKSKQSLKKALMQDLLTGKKRVKVDS